MPRVRLCDAVQGEKLSPVEPELDVTTDLMSNLVAAAVRATEAVLKCKQTDKTGPYTSEFSDFVKPHVCRTGWADPQLLPPHFLFLVL